MANTVKIQAYLSPELFSKFEAHRRSTEKSISNIISLALEEYLDRRDSPPIDQSSPDLEKLTERIDRLEGAIAISDSFTGSLATQTSYVDSQVVELKNQIESLKSTMVQLWQAISVKITPVPEEVLDGTPQSDKVHQEILDSSEVLPVEELPIITYLSANNNPDSSPGENSVVSPTDGFGSIACGEGEEALSTISSPSEEETTDSVEPPPLRYQPPYPATVINDWDSTKPINYLTSIHGLTCLLLTDQQFCHRMDVKQSTLNTKKRSHPTQQAKWSQDKDCNNFFWVWHPAKKLWLGRSPDQIESIDWKHP